MYKYELNMYENAYTYMYIYIYIYTYIYICVFAILSFIHVYNIQFSYS